MPDYTSSHLRYVDADKLDTRVLDLDGLDVRNTRDDHIGDVEGLLIDTVSGRPRYLVIDSGGWFRSRRFLLPIAHARLDENRRTLRVDFDKETINRFPEMRSDRYEALTDEELRSYDEGVWRSSGVTRPTAADTRGTTDYNTSPTWWNSTAWASTVVPGTAAGTAGRPMVASEEVMGRSEDAVRARAEHERMVAHERDDLRTGTGAYTDRDNDRLVAADVHVTETYVDRDRDSILDRNRTGAVARDDARDRARSAEIDRDQLRDRDDTRAPAVGERAQPGDILGIESAGETTSLGDTASDEDKRRESAEEDIQGVKIEPDTDKRRRR
jgi:PRC-barrel domain